MKYLSLFLVITFAISASCTAMKDGKPTIKQGIYGKVIWQEGNMMPSPDAPSGKTGKPVSRKLRIYELTKMSEVTGNSPLFTTNSAKLIAETTANEEGNFQCKLNPGSYSIFTVEPDGFLFGNLFNGKGEIMAFEVKEEQLTQLNIYINYKAAF